MLCELGLEYETREIIPRTSSMDDPDFRRLGQRGKVPILEHGDVAMGESGAILLWLADRYRDRAVLAPEPGSDARAVFDDLCLFSLMELDAPLYIVRRHEGLADVYGEAPTAVASAKEYFTRQSGEMLRRLSDGRAHLMGDDFSAADILLSTCLAWAQTVDIGLPEVLTAYQTRVTAREAFGRAARTNFTPAAMAMLRGER